jgi:hypothetical protein
MGSPFGRLFIAAALLMLLSPAALAQLTVPIDSSFDVADGSMSLGCTPLDVDGTLSIDSGQVSDISEVNIGTTGTINGGQGTLNVSGDWNNLGTFVPGTGTVNFTDGCAVGPVQISGATVFNNLTLTSTVGRTFIIPAGENITVNGILTLQGTEDQPIQLVSSSGEPAVIGLGPSAQVIQNFAIVSANVQIGELQIGATPRAIPTMSDYGLIILLLLIAGTALWGGRIGAFSAMRKH